MTRRLNADTSTVLLARLDEPDINVTDGLVAYYKMDDNAGTTVVLDGSGNSHDGTLNGGRVTSNLATAGRRDGALDYNGSTDYVVIPHHVDFDMSVTNRITLACWFKSDLGSSGATQILIRKPANTVHAPPYVDWTLYISSYLNGLCVKMGEDADYAAGGGLTAGVWYHGATTYDGSRVKLFLNGIEVGSYAKTNSLTERGYPLRLAAHQGAGELLNGCLDEVRVYNRALTTTEIANLFYYGRGVVDVGPSGLTMTNIGTTAVTGIVDMPFTVSRRFTRSASQYLYAQDSSLHTAAITAECWFKLASIPTGLNYAIAGNYNSNGWIFGVQDSGGIKLFFYIQSHSTPYLRFDGSALAIDVWYHMACTFNTTARKVYLNGALLGGDTGGTIGYSSGAQTQLGYCNYSDWHFDGQIADFRLSNRARAPWEIANTVKAVTDPQVGFEVEAGSVAVYNFNNALEGSTVYDDTGNHNGSVVGSVPLVPSPVSRLSRSFIGSTANQIQVVNHADFSIDADFSVEAWVRLTSTSGYQTILAKGDFNTTPMLAMMFYNGTNIYSFLGSGPSVYWMMYATYTWTVNSWYYMTVTWDKAATKLLLYINGALLGVGALTGSPWVGSNTTLPLQMGARYIVPDNPLNGRIGAVRWSNYIKTPKEIYDTYLGSNIKEVG